MPEIVKKISMPDTLLGMRAKSTVCIPYDDIRSSTIYNSVRNHNLRCGWKQWSVKLVNSASGKDYYRITRHPKSDISAAPATTD